MRSLRGCGVLAAAVVAISACAGWEDYDAPVQREIPEGRGLLSGEDGEFAIELGREPAEAESEEPETGDAETSEDEPEAP